MTSRLSLFSALLLSACTTVPPVVRSDALPPPPVAAHDWTLQQVVSSKDQLNGFCSAAPRLFVTLSWSF